MNCCCFFVVGLHLIGERTFFELISTTIALFFSSFSSHLRLCELSFCSIHDSCLNVCSSPGLSSRLWCFRLSCAQFMCYWCSVDCCILLFTAFILVLGIIFLIFYFHLISHLHPVNISWSCWLGKKFVCSSALIFAHCSISLIFAFYIFMLIVILEDSEYLFLLILFLSSCFIWCSFYLHSFEFCTLLLDYAREWGRIRENTLWLSFCGVAFDANCRQYISYHIFSNVSSECGFF